MKDFNLSVVVVLYHPLNDFIDNIQSYCHNVRRLYIIDNSEIKNMKVIQELKKIPNSVYIDNHGNKGIAHALNTAAVLAIDEHYEWMLTMDQDSRATLPMLSHMVSYIEQCGKDKEKISIVSPFHSNPYQSEAKTNEKYTEVITAMTSGCLLNLKNYQKIGAFLEEFFIDHVDHEYCLRSKIKGYSIIQVNHAILQHNVGRLKQHKLFGKQFFSTNHSSIRSYYSFRNRIRLIQLYYKAFPKYCFDSFIRFFIDPMIVLFYEGEKRKKLKMMFLGIRDALRNKYGKFND